MINYLILCFERPLWTLMLIVILMLVMLLKKKEEQLSLISWSLGSFWYEAWTISFSWSRHMKLGCQYSPWPTDLLMNLWPLCWQPPSLMPALMMELCKWWCWRMKMMKVRYCCCWCYWCPVKLFCAAKASVTLLLPLIHRSRDEYGSLSFGDITALLPFIEVYSIVGRRSTWPHYYGEIKRWRRRRFVGWTTPRHAIHVSGGDCFSPSMTIWPLCVNGNGRPRRINSVADGCWRHALL